MGQNSTPVFTPVRVLFNPAGLLGLTAQYHHRKALTNVLTKLGVFKKNAIEHVSQLMDKVDEHFRS